MSARFTTGMTCSKKPMILHRKYSPSLMRLKKLKLRKVKKMSKWSLKSVLSDLLNSKDLSPDERADLRRAIEKLKDM